MNRYWVSWWSGNYATEPPFTFWVSARDCSLYAVIDNDCEAEVWPLVATHFLDLEPRFLELRDPDWQPALERVMAGRVR